MDSIFASIYPKLTPEDQEVLRQEMRESFGYERELGAITGIELCKFILSERDEKRAVAALRTDATFQKALGRMEQRIAEAVAAEREACCRDVCTGCAEGMPLEFTERPDSGVRPRPPAWIHWWGSGVWSVCYASTIHERARAGEE